MNDDDCVRCAYSYAPAEREVYIEIPIEDRESLVVTREEYLVSRSHAWASTLHMTCVAAGTGRGHTLGSMRILFRVSACSRVGRDFFSDHGMKQSVTFSIRRCGEHTCAVFLWVLTGLRKTAWLHPLSVDAGCGGTSVFGDTPLANFVEPSECAEIAGSASGHLAERVRDRRENRPLWESEE